VLDRPEVVIDLLEPNPNIEAKKDDEELGTTAGLREAARSLSTAAFTWYAIAVRNELASGHTSDF
jgi:hypothetical protein